MKLVVFQQDSACFAKSKQSSIAIFTASFCFANAEHNLIKLKL